MPEFSSDVLIRSSCMASFGVYVSLLAAGLQRARFKSLNATVCCDSSVDVGFSSLKGAGCVVHSMLLLQVAFEVNVRGNNIINPDALRLNSSWSRCAESLREDEMRSQQAQCLQSALPRQVRSSRLQSTSLRFAVHVALIDRQYCRISVSILVHSRSKPDLVRRRLSPKSSFSKTCHLFLLIPS